MTKVIEVLQEEHRNIERLLGALDHQIEVFADFGAPDYDIISGIADYFLAFPDQCHHPKENVIFERMSQVDPSKATALAEVLREHRAMHQSALRFRYAVNDLLGDEDISRASVVDAARAFIELQRAHMRKEEAEFFPLAELILKSEDWILVEGELSSKRDPLFGERLEKRFEALSARLLSWEAEFRNAGLATT